MFGRRAPAVALAQLATAGLLAVTTCYGMASGGAAGPPPAEVARDVPATANDLRAPRAHNSPVLAVDPTDSSFLALAHRLDAPDFSCGLALSGDGGRAWVGADAVTALPDGIDHCYRPQVAFDDEGTLYYLFVGLGGRGNRPQGVWLTTSEDRGRSFAQPWQVLGPDRYQVQMAINRARGERGRLHLAWLALGGAPTLTGLPDAPNPIRAAYSDDGGRTFSEPVEVSDRTRRAVAPALAVGADHRVHVVYYDLRDDMRDYQGLPGPPWPGTWAVKAATSLDGGDSFTEPVVVTDALRPPERVMLIFTMPPPAVAADGQGQVYAAWADARAGDADVLVAASADHGRAWRDPVQVSDDRADAVKLLPQLAAAPSGRLDVVYLHRHADPGDAVQQTAYATSHDQGTTFSAPKQLSTAPSDPATGPRYPAPTAQGHVEWGAGLALHSSDDRAIAAWPDTRFAVPGTVQQEIYTATVRRSTTEGLLSRWPAAIAGSLGVAVLVGLLLAVRRRRASSAPGTEASENAPTQAQADDEV